MFPNVCWKERRQYEEAKSGDCGGHGDATVEGAKITVKLQIGKGEYTKYAVEVSLLLRCLSGVVAMREWRVLSLPSFFFFF